MYETGLVGGRAGKTVPDHASSGSTLTLRLQILPSATKVNPSPREPRLGSGGGCAGAAPTISSVPLAYERMMSGKARFRVVLIVGR
jgi:hypothetical protein